MRRYFFDDDWRYSYIGDDRSPTEKQVNFIRVICRLLQLNEVVTTREQAGTFFEVYKRDFYRALKSLSDYEKHMFNMNYKSVEEKLNEMFWGKDLPEHNLRKVYTAKRKEIEKERKESRKKRNKTESQRVLKSGSPVIVKYPSGKEYLGKVFIDGLYALVEPQVPNTAAFMFDKKYATVEELYLVTIPHERIIHNKEGVDFIKSFEGRV